MSKTDIKELRNSGRRAFLRGLGGCALALPLLDFTHEKAVAQSTEAQYFVSFFAHGGSAPASAMPASDPAPCPSVGQQSRAAASSTTPGGMMMSPRTRNVTNVLVVSDVTA